MLEHNLDLTIHCKSKNDDLGEHLLHHLDSFEFAFIPIELIGETLFFCGFRWKGAFKWFDIYKGNRDVCKDNLCNWNVMKDRLCTNVGNNIEQCYPYNGE